MLSTRSNVLCMCRYRQNLTFTLMPLSSQRLGLESQAQDELPTLALMLPPLVVPFH